MMIGKFEFQLFDFEKKNPRKIRHAEVVHMSGFNVTSAEMS